MSRWITKKSILIMIPALTLPALAAFTLLWKSIARDLPGIGGSRSFNPAGVTQIYGQDGLLAEFFKERRYLIPYEKIPKLLVQAFIAAEDEHFFTHQGINPTAILRAAMANFLAGHIVQGGSTITQQLAKSIYLSPEKSFSRKIKEVMLAYRLEKELSKEEILYLYLNHIYLGHGAYGVQAASRVYFNKDVSELNLGEMAILASMPRAPSKFSPLINPKRAKERQLYVLRQMAQGGFISEQTAKNEGVKPIRLIKGTNASDYSESYYVEWVRRYLIQKYGEKAVYEEGLKVYVPTTRQRISDSVLSVQEGLRDVSRRFRDLGIVQKSKTPQERVEYLRSGGSEAGLRIARLTEQGELDESLAPETSKGSHWVASTVYPAIITAVDSAKRSVEIEMAGGFRTNLTDKNMKWLFSEGARPTEEKKFEELFSVEQQVAVRYRGQDRGQFEFELEPIPQVQGALYSMDNRSGNILAIVGGFDHRQSEFNRAYQGKRQPGSLFKPVIYSLALLKGYTAATILVDAPLVFDNEDAGKWKPSNFEEKFYGDTTVWEAMVHSRNIPTIRLVQELGINDVVAHAKKLGLNAEYPQDLSISLGSATTTLADMTSLFSLFPRNGKKLTPVLISKVVDANGRVLEDASETRKRNEELPTVAVAPEAAVTAASSPVPAASLVPPTATTTPLPGANPSLVETESAQVMDPRVANVMTYILKDVVDHGTGFKARELGAPTAGKTGTTNDYRDAWFIAFTPAVITGVWVGYDDFKSLGSGQTGANAALPIWLSFMKKATISFPSGDFMPFPGVEFVPIHPTTGKVAGRQERGVIKMPFIAGTQPGNKMGGPEGGVKTKSRTLKEDLD